MSVRFWCRRVSSPGSRLQLRIEVGEDFVNQSGAPGKCGTLGGAATFKVAVQFLPFAENGVDFSLQFRGSRFGIDESVHLLCSLQEGG